MASHDMHRLPVVRDRGASFSYACHGCGHCCHHKAIRVDPYAVARLADALGVSTTAVLRDYVDAATSTLRQSDGGACVFFDGGCSVHSGRPLPCRLYPLGWGGEPNGDESFYELSAHPQSAGVYGTDGTVADYLASQGTAPYERASWRYAEVLRRLHLAADADGPDPGAPPSITDVDEAVRHHCEQRGEPIPDDVEARVDLHLALLHAWLDAAGAPAGGCTPG